MTGGALVSKVMNFRFLNTAGNLTIRATTSFLLHGVARYITEIAIPSLY